MDEKSTPLTFQATGRCMTVACISQRGNDTYSGGRYLYEGA